MHSVKSQYSQIVAEPGHKFETRVTIAGIDYVQQDDDYSSGSLRSVSTTAHTFGSDTIQLGRADSREISLEIFGNSSRIPRNAEIKVYVRAMNEKETQYSDWIPKGTFYIDTRSKDSQLINGDEVIDIVGMDAMMRGEGVFNYFPYAWQEAGKTTAIAVMQESARLIGVSIAAQTYQIMSENFDVPLPTQYTIREALANVAGLYGGAFIINDSGELQLICPWYSEYTYDLGTNTQELIVHPAYSPCTGVRMLIADKGYTTRRKKLNKENEDDPDEEVVDYYFRGAWSSEDTCEAYGYVFNIENPWATQEQVNWLYGRMAGYVYQPFQSTTGEIDPMVEIGDSIAVGNITGGLYSQDITFGKYFTCDFGAPGEEEIDHEYQYETSTDRKYTRRLYNAEATLAIHQDEIMARVTKTGGDEDSTFGWVLESDHWDVFSGSPDNVVLHVDKDGLTVKGDGEFTGKLSSAEIYIPSEENWNFKVESNGYMTATNADISGVIRADGGIYVGNNPVATIDDLNEIRQLSGGQYSGGNALLNSLQAANSYNKAIKADSDYPDYFRAKTIVGVDSISCGGTINGKLRGTSIVVAPIDSDGGDIELATHSHTISFDEDDGKIELTIGGPSNNLRNKASFNIADTKKYKDGVSAAMNSLTLSASNHPSYNSMARVTGKVTATGFPDVTKDLDLTLACTISYNSSAHTYTANAYIRDYSLGYEKQVASYSIDSNNKAYTDGRDSVTVTASISEGSVVTSYEYWRKMYVPQYIPVTYTATGSNGKSDSHTHNVNVNSVWSDGYSTGYEEGVAYGEKLHEKDFQNGVESSDAYWYWHDDIYLEGVQSYDAKVYWTGEW